jgi:superfamily I DNA/RNA helicase
MLLAMNLPASVALRLDRLAPDQRAAATAPPGPVLCVAPAGSGKTTTLVARIAWLIATGVPPDEIAAITFNRRAAVELRERLDGALDWLPSDAREVRVRTFHALGMEILRSTRRPLERLVARETVLHAVVGRADRATLGRLDAAISRLKLELDVDPGAVAADADAGPIARTFVAYEAWLARAGAIDFDDLVRLALHALEGDDRLLRDWRTRCAHLLVDETQDVDRSQLRLALLLAAPANRIFLVGDDDQSIYGWRLADVRRVLTLDDKLPGLRRIDLEVNYRCPAPVLARAVRLVEHNRERFAKAIRAGPASAGRLVLAPDGSDETDRIERVLASWSGLAGTQAILARTNRELLPAAAMALELGIPFRAPALQLLVEATGLESVLEDIEAMSRTRPLLPAIEGVRARLASDAEAGAARAAAVPPTSRMVNGEPAEPADESLSPDVEGAAGAVEPAPAAIASAMLAWAVPYPDAGAFATAVRAARRRVLELRRDDAALTLATAHATKGLEFDHVAVIGMDGGRFPSARALADADEPDRALEEERRLAYVAWTRARRSLTLVYDPANPSAFLHEAFTTDELGLVVDSPA